MHDEIFGSVKIKIPGDICNTGGFKITESYFQKGIDLAAGDPYYDKQNYFLEIIVLDATAESKKFGLDDTSPQQMEVVKSEGAYFEVGRPKYIIFPLLVKPRNDIEGANKKDYWAENANNQTNYGYTEIMVRGNTPQEIWKQRAMKL